MVREGFRKLRDLAHVCSGMCVRKQPLKPPAELEEQLSGMPETQAQRLLRRWKRSRARSSRVAHVCGSKGTWVSQPSM